MSRLPLYVAVFALCGVARADDPETQANVMVELSFSAAQNYLDPFNEVSLDVVFTGPDGRELRVPAFWDGANAWKVRYASPLVGMHSYRTECSKPADKGLHGVTGQVKVNKYEGANPLYAHGPLKQSANKRYLEYNDGTPFFWLGDTWWMGLCHRMRWPEDIQKLAADRKAKGFNVIQLVAGLYPDMHPFDPRGANEAGYPWEAEYARIRPEYFVAADTRIQYLVDQGFTPCIVGAWGYFIPWMGVEKMQQHWRYLVARYGALPVVWCVAGEANLPWYLAKGFPYDDRGQVKDWTEVMRYVRATDPYHRLVTIHPTGIGRLSARNATDDTSLLDIDMLQTPHGQHEAVAPTIRTMRESYADKPIMPVINGEASYEMLMDKIPAQWPRAMFWTCMLNGAAGHTYGANGIWQVNRKGQPHGPSPHNNGGNGYGTIPWDEAMNFPGSQQVALGKKLLERYPWQRFTPHPEWAAFTQESAIDLSAANWIWFPEGSPAKDAPAEKRFFRKAFKLPDGHAIERARLFVTVDDSFSAFLNGESLGSAGDWRTGKTFDDVARLLKPGVNVLAIAGQNHRANVPANPAGMLAKLEVILINGESLQFVTDVTWRCANSPVDRWEATSFDDSNWSAAIGIARYGEAPWGRVGLQSDLDAPQAAGIPGELRVIWVPRRDPIVVRDLGANTHWSALLFNPSNGDQRIIGTVMADRDGHWRYNPPDFDSPDWVVVLEMQR